MIIIPELNLVYDFNRLTIEQAESAREVAEWKISQIESPPDDFNLILRSRGNDYLPLLCSFLFVPLKDGIPLPFDPDKRPEVENILRNAPVSILPILRDAVNDFFSNMKLQPVASLLLQTQAERNFQTRLLKILLDLKEKDFVSSKEPKNELVDSNQMKFNEDFEN